MRALVKSTYGALNLVAIITKDIPKIYSQGALDGGCFLYSVANAYTTLLKRRFEKFPQLRQNWNKALLNIPFAIDFLLYDIGTDRYNIGEKNYNISTAKGIRKERPKKTSYKLRNQDGEDDHTLFLLAIKTILYEISAENPNKKPKLDVKYLPYEKYGTRRELRKSIDKNSVLVLCISHTDNQEDLDHWVCVTGKSGSNRLEVACSWILLNPDRDQEYKYVERKGFQNRIHNDWITLSNLDDSDFISDLIFKIYKR
ncbi:hypothetical protein [Desulfobacula sp.]|uniref:hypothetical protein n=1 Tax=Desulfobacula sp. TaxID=2593537 RepID=UPI001EB56641|nr:hypothetical protein [Desulfobacula sp.]